MVGDDLKSWGFRIPEAGKRWPRAGWNHNRADPGDGARAPVRHLVGARLVAASGNGDTGSATAVAADTGEQLECRGGDSIVCMAHADTGVMAIAVNGKVVDAIHAPQAAAYRALRPCVSFRKPFKAIIALGSAEALTLDAGAAAPDAAPAAVAAVQRAVFMPVSRWTHATSRAKVMGLAKARYGTVGVWHAVAVPSSVVKGSTTAASTTLARAKTAATRGLKHATCVLMGVLLTSGKWAMEVCGVLGT